MVSRPRYADWRRLILGKNSRKFLRTVKQLRRNGLRHQPTTDIVLLDGMTTYEPWVMAACIAVTALAHAENASVVTFAGTFSRRPWHRRFLSAIADSKISVRPSQAMNSEARRIAHECLDGLRAPGDLMNLHVNGVWVGPEILETYLRQGHFETDLTSPKLRQIAEAAIAHLLFWEAYFDSASVKSMLLADDAYSAYGVPAKVAYARGVPVYLLSGFSLQRTGEPHGQFKQAFPQYRKMFEDLIPPFNRGEALGLGHAAMQRRMSGAFDPTINLPWSTDSSFRKDAQVPDLVALSPSRMKVVVAAHCFFDRPHVYGGMLFSDFMEWLMFVGEAAQASDHDWLIKLHRDPLPGNQRAIDEFLARYPLFSQVPANVSWQDLAASGVSHVLTCYGTVGHELPALGVQVLSMGFNPHVAYDFVTTFRSLDEAKTAIASIADLKASIELKQMDEFYFVHYYLMRVDDLLFPSYQEMMTRYQQGWGIEDLCGFYFSKADSSDVKFTYERIKSFVESEADVLTSAGPYCFRRG